MAPMNDTILIRMRHITIRGLSQGGLEGVIIAAKIVGCILFVACCECMKRRC